MSSPKTLEPGMQITKAVSLLRPLSSGGMGAVWLADHLGLKTQVVVKFMLGDLGSSESARGRFSREAAAAAQVKSPHVVQMLDHGVSDDGIPFIVMEHLEGHDLGDEIEKNGALEPSKVVAIVSQVGKALSKVHAAGLLHRDIKPDNIFLVDGEEEVFAKLLDFGIAKSQSVDGADGAPMDSETKTGQIVGTPFYMSPEQVTAQKAIDSRADLWALGVVAFEALTGKRPFDGPSFGALAVMIATGTPPKPSEVNPALPPAVDAWFAKACAREAAQRFATAKELSDGLRAAFEGSVSLLPSSDSGQRSASTPSGNRISSSSGSRPASPTFGLAATAVDPSTGDREAALARSEAGVSLADRARPPSRGSATWLLAGGALLVVVALVLLVVLGSKPAEGTTSIVASATGPISATASPSPSPSPPATLDPTAPSAHPSPGSSVALSELAPIDAGAPARAPAVASAGARNVKPPPAVTATTTVRPEPTAKPTARPASSEPDLF